MIKIRPSQERGHADHGWLKSKHTFSFAGYHDPEHMGFRGLRVINEDRVAAGRGFGTHPHRDMEIISYVVDGALEHKDSMGTGSVIVPGDVQRMTAGTGVTHSEFNHSASEEVRFLQIWLLPDRRGLEPGYEQKTFDPDSRRGRLRLIASQDGVDDSISVNHDLRLYDSQLRKGEQASLALDNHRHAWIQVVDGSVVVNGTTLRTGDGASIVDEQQLHFSTTNQSHFLVFDLS